jgi:hypothetical protein
MHLCRWERRRANAFLRSSREPLASQFRNHLFLCMLNHFITQVGDEANYGLTATNSQKRRKTVCPLS